MNAISTLTVLPQSKEQIAQYVMMVKDDILSGYVNPLESALMLKAFEDILTALKGDKDIRAYIEQEADKYVEKTIDFHGAKITKQDRAKYDFENCEDSTLKLLYQQAEQIKCNIKARESWLKTLKEPTVCIETGEVINPPAKTKQVIISITLKK